MPPRIEIAQSRNGHDRESGPTKTFYFLVLLEILIQATVNWEKDIVSQPSYRNNTISEDELENQLIKMKVIGGSLGVFCAAIADSYTGCYYLYIALYIVGCFRSVLEILITAKYASGSVKSIAFEGVGILLAVVEITIPLRYAIVFRQQDLPRQVNNIRRLACIYFVGNCLGHAISSLLKNEIGNASGPINLYCVLLLFLNVFYVLSFGIMKPYLKPEKIVPHVTFKLVSCIFVGFYRKLKALVTRKKNKPSHWLDRTENDFDEHFVYNAKVFSELMKLFLPLLSAYCVTGFLYLLMNDQRKKMKPHLTFSFFTTRGFTSLSDIFAIGTLEIMVVPLLRTCGIRWKMMRFLGISYALLALSLCTALAIEISIESNATFLPDHGFGQIRFYNAFEGISYLQSNLFGLKNESNWIEMQARSMYVVARAVTHSQRSAEVRVKLSASTRTLDFIEKVVIVERQSISYVVTLRGLQRVKDFDPLVSGPPGMNNPNFPRIFILCGIPFCYGGLTLKNKVSMNQVSLPETTERLRVFTVAANSYNVTIEQGELTLSLGRNVKFEYGGVYAILIHSLNTIIGGTVFTVVNPGTMSQLYLLPQVLLFSAAKSLLVPAAFEFMYIHSPPKLLASTIACLYTPNGVAFALVTLDLLTWHSLVNYNMILFYLILHIVMTVFHFYLAINFKGQTWTLEGVVYDKHQPSVTTHPKLEVVPFTRRSTPHLNDLRF